jgi:hypothetical protein
VPNKNFDAIHLICFAFIPVLIILFITKPQQITKTETKTEYTHTCNQIKDSSLRPVCVAAEACATQKGRLANFKQKYDSGDWSPEFSCQY